MVRSAHGTTSAYPSCAPPPVPRLALRSPPRPLAAAAAGSWHGESGGAPSAALRRNTRQGLWSSGLPADLPRRQPQPTTSATTTPAMSAAAVAKAWLDSEVVLMPSSNSRPRRASCQGQADFTSSTRPTGNRSSGAKHRIAHSMSLPTVAPASSGQPSAPPAASAPGGGEAGQFMMEGSSRALAGVRSRAPRPTKQMGWPGDANAVSQGQVRRSMSEGLKPGQGLWG